MIIPGSIRLGFHIIATQAPAILKLAAKLQQRERFDCMVRADNLDAACLALIFAFLYHNDLYSLSLVSRSFLTEPIWRNLPFAAAQRVVALPPVWLFGGLPAAQRFARLLGDAAVGPPALL